MRDANRVLWLGKLAAGCIALALACLSAAADSAVAGELQWSIDFEGGSAEVESIDQQQRAIRISPTPHKDRGWACWWYFKLSGLEPGETITLDVGKAPWATPDRAMMSTDGRTWCHTASGKRSGPRIVFRQPVDAEEVWFAWGPPFVPSDAKALVKRVAGSSPEAESFELCRTRADRPVPAVRIGGDGKSKRFGIWIQARQHAWESGASWVCQGLAEWLISDDPRAERLREQALVIIVPIMDIDNTAIGAGGKDQKPHDHNRDWCDTSHWPSVAAAMEQIEAMDSAGRFDLFVDLHNPDANSKRPFFYVSPDDLLSPQGRENQRRFLEAAGDEMTGSLPLDPRPKVSGPGYHPLWKQISKNWVNTHTTDHVVAVTLETAWNTPHSTTEGYQQVGRELGLAIERYFRVDPRAN